MKPYQKMTLAELRKATKEFDREFIADKSRAMNPSERARNRQLRRGRGRPRVGKGAKKINVCLERGLLNEVDRFAQKRGLKRSELIARILAQEIGRSKAAE